MRLSNLFTVNRLTTTKLWSINKQQHLFKHPYITTIYNMSSATKQKTKRRSTANIDYSANTDSIVVHVTPTKKQKSLQNNDNVKTSSNKKQASTGQLSTSATNFLSNTKRSSSDKKVKQPTITEKKYLVAQKYVAENTATQPHEIEKIKYEGYIPPIKASLKDNNITLDIIDIDSIDYMTFYNKYIATRTPVIINNITSHNDFNKLKQWNNIDYLQQYAGNETVSVEYRSNLSGEFGKGIKKQMSFNDFLILIQSDDQLHYISTQPHNDSDDITEQLTYTILQAPLTKLLHDVTLHPALTHNMIPYQYNIWMGNSKNWVSSSLHHDFHDNLYILLSGQKRFTLFPPSDIYAMKVYGNIHQVYNNGLISYDSCPTREDGVPLELLMQEQATKHNNHHKTKHSNKQPKSIEEVEELISKYEIELEKLQENNADQKQIDNIHSKLAEAEDMLDAALDGQLGSAAEFATSNDTDDASSVASNVTDNNTTQHTSSTTQSTTTNNNINNNTMPENFSRMNTKALRMNSPLALGKMYAELVTAHRVIVTLKPNQGLYLPCGWFHEVSSMSGNDMKSIAFNYWFHPPDSLNNVEQPYKHDYWQKQWNTVKQTIEHLKQQCVSSNTSSQSNT